MKTHPKLKLSLDLETIRTLDLADVHGGKRKKGQPPWVPNIRTHQIVCFEVSESACNFGR